MTPIAASFSPHEQSTLFHQRLPLPVRKRLHYLRPHDRALVELVLIRQLPRYQIARLLDCPPGTVSRRIQRLSARLYDPIVSDLLDEKCTLPFRARQLAIEYFLHGQSQRTIARRHGFAKQYVGRTLDYVRGWHQRQRMR